MTTATLANRYPILDTLGQGAMGVVYRVDDPIGGRQAALKVISKEVGRNERSILQFKQEFRLMTQLRHPNCCEVYDYGVLADGEPYFTMELVPGQGLDECLPLDLDQFRTVFAQLLLALGYVHQQGFVHRDLKSMNVRLRPDGTVKLMDYGLMTYVGQANPGISGTVAYMAPEVIKRGPVDPRSDLYSAGCLAYELLTGRVPFEGDVPMEVLRAHVNNRPEPLYRLVPQLDPQVERVVLKLLEKEPLARYQSAQEVLEDLGFEAPPGLGGSLLTSPLVGRESELKALTSRLERTARGGHEAPLVLHGPPGIGKSRLVEAFRYTAQLELVPCAMGRPTEHENAPYSPFIMVLRSLLPELVAHAPEALARHAPVLVKLLPELKVASAPEMDHPNREKMRLQTAIAEVLYALAAQRPIALVLEDWHWADALSRDMLDYLLRNSESAPLMVLVTTREVPTGTLASRTVGLGLPPLEMPELGRMAGSMLGTPEVDPVFLRRLADLCEGSPLYLERLLDHLVKRGILSRQQGRWNMAVEIPHDTVLENLSALLADRLAILPPPALALARAAAVAGAECHLDVLKDVTGFDDDTLFDALSELERQRLLLQTGPGTYRFAQDLVHNLIYTQLDEDERQRLHGRVARSLEAELWILPLPQVPFEQISAIANHCLLSSTPESAITYALEAGRRSAQIMATAEAHHFLTRGLALVQADPNPVWKPLHLSYLRLLGDLDRVTGALNASRDTYQAAIALAEALEDDESLGRLLTSQAKVQQALNDLPAAIRSCEGAYRVSISCQDYAGAARALDTSCRARYFTGDAAAAVSESEQAVAYALQGNLPAVRANAEAFLGYLLTASAPERFDEGLRHLHTAVTDLTDLGDLFGLANALQLVGLAQIELGELEAAWATFTRHHEICRRANYTAEASISLLNLGQIALERGDYIETFRRAEVARQIALQLNARYQEGLALILAAAAHAATGELDTGRDEIATALGYAQSLQHKFLEAIVRQYQMEIELQHGSSLDTTREAADALRALIAETGFTEPAGRLALADAWLDARAGRLDEARHALERMAENPKFARNRILTLRVQHLRAWLALQAEQHEEATRIATAARDQAGTLGAEALQDALAALCTEIEAATKQATVVAARNQNLGGGMWGMM